MVPLPPSYSSIVRKVVLVARLKMLVLVPARAERVRALALDQAWEAAGLAQGRGWAERPVRHRLVQVLLA